jgi:hypothetical protein
MFANSAVGPTGEMDLRSEVQHEKDQESAGTTTGLYPRGFTKAGIEEEGRQMARYYRGTVRACTLLPCGSEPPNADEKRDTQDGGRGSRMS